MSRRKKIGATKPPRAKQPTVAMHLPENPVDLEPHVATSLDELGKDQRFAALAPQITKAKTDNGTLATAIQAATNGGPLEHSDMLLAAEMVREDMRELKPLVQGVLRTLPPDQVPAILATILMSQSKVGTRHTQPPLRTTQGPSGSVLLKTLRIVAALVYFWEVSSDGTNWTLFQKSSKPHTTATNLTAGKQYWFRVSAFLRDDTTTPYVAIGPFMVT
jgi:hypothetical protein